MEKEDILQDEEVKRAIRFAEKAHEGQVRKKDGVTPYVNHALKVMNLLVSCMDYEFSLEMKAQNKDKPKKKLGLAGWVEKYPEEFAEFLERYKTVVIAGVLHDVVEDTNKNLSRDVKLRRLAEDFGEGVAEIVDVMTEWKENGYDDRKNTQQKRIEDASRAAKLVKCADNIANVGETVADCKEGDLHAWEVYKIKPTQVVENHLNTICALEELQGNPLFGKLCQIVRDSLKFAQEREAMGTEFWDEKARLVNAEITEDNAAELFQRTYKGL